MDFVYNSTTMYQALQHDKKHIPWSTPGYARVVVNTEKGVLRPWCDYTTRVVVRVVPCRTRACSSVSKIQWRWWFQESTLPILNRANLDSIHCFHQTQEHKPTLYLRQTKRTYVKTPAFLRTTRPSLVYYLARLTLSIQQVYLHVSTDRSEWKLRKIVHTQNISVLSTACCLQIRDKILAVFFLLQTSKYHFGSL